MDQNLQYLTYVKQNFVFTTTSAKVNAPTFRQYGHT